MLSFQKFWTVEKYEGINFSSSTRWCVLSGLRNLKPKYYPLPFGYLNIKCNLSIITSTNKSYATASGKGTWIFFIYNIFGPNTNRRHVNSWALFDFKNHLIKPTPKTKSPNWRVQPLLMSL